MTATFDRDLPEDHPTCATTVAPRPFRALAAELDVTLALLADRYALTVPRLSTVVLVVKNREELRECLAAADLGPLAPEMTDRVDRSVRGA